MKAVLFTWLLSLFTGITATEDFARLLNDASSQVNSFFVDSRNTYYDGYQQAWRYLGFYVDCYTKEGTKVCQRYLLWAAVRSKLRLAFVFSFNNTLTHSPTNLYYYTVRRFRL
jgi:hypothetical protein